MVTRYLFWPFAGAAVIVLGSVLGCGPTEPARPAQDCQPGAECTTVSSECLALVDNATRTKSGLRIAQLTMTAPQILTSGIVADTVADLVELDRRVCNLAGKGSFHWLLELDFAAGTLRTGGAKSAAAETGYCFVNELVAGRQVGPKQVSAPVVDGEFSATIDTGITIPIYLDPAGAAVVLLPLGEIRVAGTLSSDRNCIGRYNAEGLDPAHLCLGDDRQRAFVDAGVLDGFVTLEDADSVDVTAANKSLCVLLSGNAGLFGDGQKPIERCRRDANARIMFLGDWCSQTNSPGGCGDAARLGADFSASGVEITGDCGG